MTDLSNNSAGGTNAAAVTPANSGGASGDAFNSVVIAGGGLTYDNTDTINGGLTIVVAGGGTSGGSYVAWSSLNGNQFRGLVYAKFTALPSVEKYLIWFSATTVVQASLGVLATGKIVQRASNTAGTGNSGSVTIPLNQWLRFEFAGTIGASGTMQSAMYTANSTTPLDALSTTAQNTGTANVVNVRFGDSSTNTDTDTFKITGMRAGDASSTFYGPTSTGVNTPPTISGPGTVNTAGTTANLTFTASDTGGGTIASFVCGNPSNTALSTVTPTIGSPTLSGIGTANATATFPITGLTANAKYFFSGTATDNNGAVSNTSVATINATRDAPDIRLVTATGFTVVGGGTATDCIIAGNAQAAAGQTVTHYLESTAPPGGASVVVTYQPATSSSVPKLFTFPVRAKDTTTTETATVTLKMNDTTTIATRGPFTLTTTAAACGGTTTTSETAAITDPSKLSITVVTN